jgi:hypothetical protein
MNEYALIFRREQPVEEKPSPAELQASIKPWQEWIGSIAAQNKLVNKGIRLKQGGYTLKPDDVITNGPYSETKEIIGGLIIIKAQNHENAVEIAKACPLLFPPLNGTVEVREIFSEEALTGRNG